MEIIQWNDSFSVKVAAMDKEHRKLVDMINALNDAMEKGKGKDIVAKIIDGLLAYAKTHFADEEKLMAQYAFPELASQADMHAKFAEKVIEYKKQHDGGNILLSLSVVKFMSNWLRSHIQVEDKKYGVYLNAKGVT